MSKVADVKFGWTRSASQGVTRQIIEVTINGTDVRTIELGPEVESYMLEVSASSSVSFVVRTIDDEGNDVASEAYHFAIGDMVAPLPATNLFHEVVAVRDVVEDTTEDEVVVSEEDLVSDDETESV